MKYVWTIVVVMSMALAACQPGEGPALVPETGATEATLPSSTLEGALIEMETPASPTAEDIDMTPSPPFDESVQELLSLVRQHLAQQLNLPVDQITVSNVQPVVWRDAGLGCPKPGVDYIQMETPGYTILLEASGETYAYHTDEDKRFVQCNQ